MRRLLLPLLTLLLALPAAAEESAAAPAPAAAPVAEKEERESPDWYTESSVFGRGADLKENPPFVTRGFGNGVIVGMDAAGVLVDARDGRRLSDAEAEAALKDNDVGGTGLGVTIFHTEKSGSKGITKGKLKDGSYELAKGKLGSVDLEAGNAWGYGAAGAAIGTDGVRVAGMTGGTLTLVGVSGSTKTAGFGKKDDRVKGAAEGYSYAMLGADGSVSGLVRVGRDALAVGARVGAFVGASTGVSGIGELDVAGVAVRILAGVSAGYGLGGEAYGLFKIDWANWAVRVGGQALAALGPAAGMYLDVEISLKNLMKKLGVTDALSKGVGRVTAAIKAGALRVARGLGFLSKDAAAKGVAAGRDAETAQQAAAPASPAVAAGAAGAGVSRD